MSVFTWGLLNTTKENKLEKTHIPKHVSLPIQQGEFVTQVSTGHHFTLCLTNQGHVYSWGINKYGRLGRPISSSSLSSSSTTTKSCWSSSIPKLIQFSSNEKQKHVNVEIINISAGYRHAVAIDKNGNIYAWGYNKNGILGENDEHESIISVPIQINSKSFLSTFFPRKPQKVICGMDCSAIFMDDGSVWAWGNNSYQRLGCCLSKENIISTPSLIQLPSQSHSSSSSSSSSLSANQDLPVNITDIAFGYHFGLACTSDGNVYSWGRNQYGQLGIRHLSNSKKRAFQSKPIRISFDDESNESISITKVAASKGEFYCHAAAISNHGELYTWGSNYKGKLGTGDTHDSIVPVRVPIPSLNNSNNQETMEPVLDVDCGGIHMAAVTTRGRIYTWGCGSDGRLGHPESKNHRYLFREYEPRQVTEGIPSHRQESISQVSCSYYHTAVLIL